MPDDQSARSGSTFEDDFREFHGRAPTPEETRKHLAFDRLAKSSSLDPLSLLLIVDAQRMVKQKAPALIVSASARDLLAFAAALASFTGIVAFVTVWAPQAVSVAAYCGAIALGVAASAAYVLIAGSRRS